ncbi:MAG: PaaI family thioesterase [Mangrovibacterium sp.]|nr:PaaI family thioesterase [Mangrovibacterium sp.]
MNLEKLKTYFQNDRFAALTGVRLLEAGNGYCRAMLEIEDRHLNSANVVQGGAIFTLADFAFAVASNSRGQLALAINANISFLKAKSNGILFATAKEVTDPTRIGAYEVLITDENHTVVAQFNGMAYRKNEPHSF